MAVDPGSGRVARAAATFAAGFGALAALALHLGALRPPGGSVLLGATAVAPGRNAAFRVAHDDGEGNLTAPRAVWAAVEVGGRTTGAAAVWRAATPQADWVDVVLPVPQILGPLQLRLRVDGGDGDDDLVQPLQAVAAGNGLQAARRVSWTANLEPRRRAPTAATAGTPQLALYPLGGELVGGLVNEVAGQLSLGGAPLAARLTAAALGVDVQSDARGALRFALLPPPAGVPWQFTVTTAARPPTVVEVPLVAWPRQLLLRPGRGPAVDPAAAALPVHIDTLPSRGPIYLELRAGEASLWVGQTSPRGGAVDVAVPLPTGPGGWLQVSAYRSPLAPGDSGSSAFVFRGTAADAEVALRRAAPGGAGEPASEAALPLPVAASRLVPEGVGGPLLQRTAPARQAAFVARREALRRRLHRLVGGLTALGAVAAAAHVGALRRRLRREVGAALQEADAAAAVAGRTAWVRLALIAAALGLAGYGTFSLLAQLRWR